MTAKVFFKCVCHFFIKGDGTRINFLQQFAFQSFDQKRLPVRNFATPDKNGNRTFSVQTFFPRLDEFCCEFTQLLLLNITIPKFVTKKETIRNLSKSGFKTSPEKNSVACQPNLNEVFVATVVRSRVALSFQGRRFGELFWFSELISATFFRISVAWVFGGPNFWVLASSGTKLWLGRWWLRLELLLVIKEIYFGSRVFVLPGWKKHRLECFESFVKKSF